jgi:hypothetical protein
VSGEPDHSRVVALANDRRGVVAASVRSLADLPAELPRAALVGGLAVMVRLNEAHRVTTDFDEVTEGRDATIALLVAQGAQRTANGVLLADRGVRLDLLDAGHTLAELGPIAAGELGDDERLAVQLALVNRYALDTAVLTDIVVLEANGVVEAQVSLPVAVAGALVAMKLNAARSPTRSPDKAAGDLYDAYRLIRAWGPTVIADDLARAPVELLRTTWAQVRHVFVDDAGRTARALRSASVPGVDPVDLDDLAAVGVVADFLHPFLVWD